MDTRVPSTKGRRTGLDRIPWAEGRGVAEGQRGINHGPSEWAPDVEDGHARSRLARLFLDVEQLEALLVAPLLVVCEGCVST